MMLSQAIDHYIQMPAGDWKARKYQGNFWRYMMQNKPNMRAVWVVHRRGGKDETILRATSCKLMQRVGTYWHMAPTNKQVRRIIWQAINPHTGKRRIDEVFPKAIRYSTNETDMRIIFKNGSQWCCLGSDNYDSAVGDSPVGVVFSEFALCNPKAWAYIRPMLLENGGWAVFISTPRGKNFFYKLVQVALKNPQWFCEILAATDTTVFSQDVLAQELAEYIAEYGTDVGTALFLQEYMCSFDAAIMGSVYGKWIAQAEAQGRIRDDFQVYDCDIQVHTAWDLGYDDATAIWFFQIVSNEVRIVDYYENNGQDIKFYCDYLKERQEERGFRYGSHNVPHDARNKLLAAGGRSIVNQAWDQGVKMIAHNATTQIQQIASTRATIKDCYFDANFCANGIEKLKSYHFKWDEKRKIFSREPYHDENSHACDAFEIIGQIWQPDAIEKGDKDDFFEGLNALPTYDDFLMSEGL